MGKIVEETEVLIATTKFLVRRGVTPYQFSIPSGKGIDTQTTKKLLKSAFENVGRSPTFSGSGPDICGISEEEWWQIECKGAGSGKSSTQRNNFDRALSSVVSYYQETIENFPEEFMKAQPILGLSLPNTKLYTKYIQDRIRMPLRKALNLWLLIYEIDKESIIAIKPNKTF